MKSIDLEGILSSAKDAFNKAKNEASEAKSGLAIDIKALKEHADEVDKAIRALEEMQDNLENLTTN